MTDRTPPAPGRDAKSIAWVCAPAATCVAAVPTGRFPIGTSPPDRGATPSAAPRADVASAPRAAAVRVGLPVTCVTQSTVPVNVELPPAPPPASSVDTRTPRAFTAVRAAAASVAACVASTPAATAPDRPSSPNRVRNVWKLSVDTRTIGVDAVNDKYPNVNDCTDGNATIVATVASRTCTVTGVVGRCTCPGAPGFGTST
jgi:hypothetical protein